MTAVMRLQAPTGAVLGSGFAPCTTSVGELAISVGLMAFNEETAIAQAIEAYLRPTSGGVRVDEVLVLASGCTDATVVRAAEVAATDPRVRIICEASRAGKLASVNRFLREARNDIVVVASADCLPGEGSIERLARAVAEPGVGMAGPRVVPTARRRSLVQQTNAVLWALHDEVATRDPKLGEVVALDRRIVGVLPASVHCDEVVMESIVRAAGQRLVYVRDAVVVNRSPQRLVEYYRLRRRIHCQHLGAAASLDYEAATMSSSRAAGAVARVASRGEHRLVHLLSAALIEAGARLAGMRDHRRGDTYATWAPSESARRDSLATAPGG